MKNTGKYLTTAGMIAAIYAVVTFLTMPLASGPVQLRPAEALAVLPCYGTVGIWGLTAGCFLANFLCGAPLPDVIFGTLATFLGALGTRALRKKGFLSQLPPIISNALILPFVLRAAYGLPGSLPYYMLTIGLSELLSAGLLGSLLKRVLEKNRALFPGEFDKDRE